MKKSIGAKTLIFPTPVLVIGTYDKNGQPNAMTCSWAGICCSRPPCVMVSVRKETYSYANLIQRKAFTLNLPAEKNLEAADLFGNISGKDNNKFKLTGLTPVKSQIVDAPLIEEFPLTVECRLIKTLEIGLHTEFIGEILNIQVDEKFLDPAGLPLIEKIKPFFFIPEKRLYYGLGKEIGKAFTAKVSPKSSS